jgi:hypothetical protein
MNDRMQRALRNDDNSEYDFGGRAIPKTDVSSKNIFVK